MMSRDETASLVKAPKVAATEQAPPAARGNLAKLPGRGQGFLLWTFVLVLCFSQPLFQLIRFAAGSELYSFILLMPLVSLYFVWLKRPDFPAYSKPEKKLTILFLLAGAVVLADYGLADHSTLRLGVESRLAFTTFAFLMFFLAISAWFLGRELLRRCVFPFGLLFFMVPCPEPIMDAITGFLQEGSAAVAHQLFRWSGTPVIQDGLVFQLPNISLRVAPECSGIHSTVVLLITSLLAGHLFLRTPWKRATLTLIVIPLALLRNGFRIFILGQLCVHISPDMIHSDIHRRGGPLFFVLSLVPLCLVLFYLRKSDRPRQMAESKPKPKT